MMNVGVPLFGPKKRLPSFVLGVYAEGSSIGREFKETYVVPRFSLGGRD